MYFCAMSDKFSLPPRYPTKIYKYLEQDLCFQVKDARSTEFQFEMNLHESQYRNSKTDELYSA